MVIHFPKLILLDRGIMKGIKFWLGVVGMAFCVGLSLLLSAMLISSINQGDTWKITVEFNRYGEGFIELILFPIMSILGLIGIMSLRSK